MMKKLLIAATLAAAAFGATSLLADPGHQHGQRGASATGECPMAGTQQGNHEQRRAEMQARMAAMHAQAGERHGGGRGEHRGQHQNRGEGCPVQQAPST
jgi:hypothetical protein